MPEPRATAAVIFKIHYWDEFVARQYCRLLERCGGLPLFVIADETRQQLDIPVARVLRMTETTVQEKGFLPYPFGRVFWYNTDYQLYHFFDLHPEFDYVFTCEFDCLVNFDIGTVIRDMAREKIGFFGEHIRVPPDKWVWSKHTAPYYDRSLKIAGRLVCCAAFSRDFVIEMAAARRAQGDQAAAAFAANSPDFLWPNNEVFVGAEIARLGIRGASFAAYGSMARYNWAPAVPEFALPMLGDCAVVHPVLEPGSCFSKWRRIYEAVDIFDEASSLNHHLAGFDTVGIVQMFLRHFIRTRDFVAVERLRHYARAHDRAGLTADGLFNVAIGRPATQSSISPWSHASAPGRDAAGAVNGTVDGRYGFHTDLEPAPWWCVDLESAVPVRGIRVFNRMDQIPRAQGLIVSHATDMRDWQVLYELPHGTSFGGIDGAPLVIDLPVPVMARFVRLHLPGEGFLHMDEVQVCI